MFRAFEIFLLSLRFVFKVGWFSTVSLNLVVCVGLLAGKFWELKFIHFVNFPSKMPRKEPFKISNLN